MSGVSLQYQVIIGLGNPGEKYLDTRHNAGFRVLDLLKKKYNGIEWVREAKGFVSRIRIKNKRIALLKPMTFMNLSGVSVATFLRLNGIIPEESVVVHDDLDIQAGQIRVKANGGHGGHNGLKSIIETLGSNEFSRIRVGIGHPGGRNNAVDFVLGSPQNDEELFFREAIEQAVSAVELMILENKKSAMDRFNRRKQPNSQE
ncbi:aminoacyl-tRNA hydrolase [bacterium]|nr:aminoacyl-tRNA hydrolase [bacterium]